MYSCLANIFMLGKQCNNKFTIVLTRTRVASYPGFSQQSLGTSILFPFVYMNKDTIPTEKGLEKGKIFTVSDVIIRGNSALLSCVV